MPNRTHKDFFKKQAYISNLNRLMTSEQHSSMSSISSALDDIFRVSISQFNKKEQILIDSAVHHIISKCSDGILKETHDFYKNKLDDKKTPENIRNFISNVLMKDYGSLFHFDKPSYIKNPLLIKISEKIKSIDPQDFIKYNIQKEDISDLQYEKIGWIGDVKAFDFFRKNFRTLYLNNKNYFEITKNTFDKYGNELDSNFIDHLVKSFLDPSIDPYFSNTDFHSILIDTNKEKNGSIKEDIETSINKFHIMQEQQALVTTIEQSKSNKIKTL